MIFGTTLLNTKCVFVFATLPETFLILRGIQRYRLIYKCLQVKYPLFLSDVKLEFYRWVFEKYSYKIS